ncbi:13 kDa tegumental antigen Sm13 [Schistosoma mansoni]|uniref:13 kDa tegumental antigen Sm13 n=2 Tax=Schistosoma mansoni TaxID=6183 RepID=Q7KPG1_SCHMA|nr:13 kDa tegumental antigen Sm13 [Schistosoma mansoni]AAC25419.1 13 kDa tegumental antigen Sm13 [Schistosoma mansoni]|eukprot:XP_018652920.1 13 kDa tegumental antigen Sm13 [Schistosoma mansoni]
MIWKILVLFMFVELISSEPEPEPEPVPVSRNSKDVSIQTDVDLDPRFLLLDLKREIGRLKDTFNALVAKIDTIPPSSIATKYIHNGLLSSICIIFTVYYHYKKS